MWLIAVIFSALFAGVTAILAKCGIKKTDSDVGLFMMNSVKNANAAVCSCIEKKISLQTWYANNRGCIETQPEALLDNNVFKN